MKILIVGSGGREHAIAWKAAQSPRKPKIYIAPGNAGTCQVGENVAICAEDVTGLTAFARDQGIDLVIVGPEASLAAGLIDELQKVGVRCFGPTQAAAQIETSKSFSKAFMQRYQISTARFACFRGYEAAIAHAQTVDYPVVIKTSGLAAGKGVILPETWEETRAALQTMLVDRVFGAAGEEVIIEERLEGEEVSLLAFTDGKTVCPMPAAQDHKRLLDGDQGPNTGGMGAYAPAPVCSPQLTDQIVRTVLQPAVDGLRAEGMPFVGVLYAGMILTPNGPRVLEFNCRFGDPETQVILPLLESDLIEIIEACVDGRLDNVTPRWKAGAAATVVLASAGYPRQVTLGGLIKGLEQGNQDGLIFHAGTRLEQNGVVTAGGRVLNVTAVGKNLQQAVERAYSAIQPIQFEGMQYRRDIAHRAFASQTNASKEPQSAYAQAGVNIDAGNRTVNLMRDAVRSTYTSEVLAGIGAFGGLFDATALQSMKSPVLVASTDGVGTKVRLGQAAGQTAGLGEDIVNHCINDILVQGARPLFFLDYFATARLEPEVTASVVSGIAAACRSAGCVILGGETAEMPGVYAPGEFDIAGTIVGVVERDKILPHADLQAGDLLVGLKSSGPHTNGYSLIRKIFANIPLDTIFPELGIPLWQALLAPHRSYLPLLKPALDMKPSPVKALAHLTGGGFIENIPRVLPDGLQAVIRLGSWPVPALFGVIQEHGDVDPSEMYRVFNMGIGMVTVVSPDRLQSFQDAVPEETWVIGELAEGQKGTVLR